MTKAARQPTERQTGRSALRQRCGFFSLLLTIGSPLAALACGGYWDPAPPTLDRYPERLPVKTMRELLLETRPKPSAPPATFDELTAEVAAIAADLSTKPREELLARIDATLQRNREGEYRKRFANCLQDFRDLLSGADIPTEQVAAYATWRIAFMEEDNGYFYQPPSPNDWSLTDEEKAVLVQDRKKQLEDVRRQISDAQGKAAAALRPHYQVQAGAWEFKNKNFAEAAKIFQQVLAESPKHPRAEIAQLMLARCRIEEWRTAHQASPRVVTERAIEEDDLYIAAKDALLAYQKAYPNGRFSPDIPGWLAGLAREHGLPDEAITLYLQQSEITGHPEVVASAIGALESCLADLQPLDQNDDPQAHYYTTLFPLKEIAKYPVASLATVYHFLDATSRHDFDNVLYHYEETTPDTRIVDKYFVGHTLRMRRTGQVILPLLARAVADEKANYAAPTWQPRYLAILAWAATEAGEHVQAIRVCNLAGAAVETSDDLLFVRSVAQQRGGDLTAAVTGYRQLRERFPESPLNAETQFRIASALRDQKEAGLAVVELLRMPSIGGDPSGHAEPVAVPNLHLASEVQQWADTLMQFAPLAQLEKGLAAKNLPPEIAARLHAILRQRYLALGSIDYQHLEIEPVELPRRLTADYYPTELPTEELKATMEELDKLSKKRESGSKLAKAEASFAMAELWSTARGKLTMPSLDDFGIFGDDFYVSWEQRQRNARAAGFKDADVTTELRSRDELHHAYILYKQAADSARDAPFAAKALFAANEAIRKMAELSPWSAARAFESGASEESRKLYDQLQKQFPDSPEARQSVYWTFIPPAETQWLPADVSFYKVESRILRGFRGQKPDDYETDDWGDDGAILEKLRALGTVAAQQPPAELLEALAALRAEFLPNFSTASSADIINHLDDLELAFSEPAGTPQARQKYLATRLATDENGYAIPPDLADSDFQSLLDYVTFLALVREKSERPMSERMAEFLAKYPQSKKREAAMARLAIAKVRETRTSVGVVSTEWPEAPKVGGYKAIGVGRGVDFDKATVFAALDAYNREFPDGRYAADVRLWRGAAAIDAADWKTAIDCLVATLDAQDKRDLHLDAALNLADVFMRLIDEPALRPDLVAALKTNPSAQTRLRQFMRSESLGARLRVFEGYLDEQYAKPQ